jgi:hypothetical protein
MSLSIVDDGVQVRARWETAVGDNAFEPMAGREAAVLPTGSLSGGNIDIFSVLSRTEPGQVFDARMERLTIYECN